MKGNLLLCSLALTLLLSGCGAGQPAHLEYIGADSAKAAAMEAAGFQANAVTFSGVDMSTREGLDYYRVEFTAGGGTYRYDIDALTGTIIDSQVPQAESDSGASGGFTYTESGNSVPQFPADGDIPFQLQTSDAVDAPTPATPTVSSAAISVEEAKAKALAQVPGATANDIREFETDYDDGRLEYEGKIHYDHMEYEFEIDGYSGAIRSWDAESIYDD